MNFYDINNFYINILNMQYKILKHSLTFLFITTLLSIIKNTKMSA